MAKIEIFIGYVGLTAQYHTLNIPFQPTVHKIVPLDLTIPKNIKKQIKLNKFYLAKAMNLLKIPQKRSTNYEGTGLNKRR